MRHTRPYKAANPESPAKPAHTCANAVFDSADYPPSPLPSDWVAIPLEACLFDPLYTGRLDGKVPDGWSRDGWIMVTRDRMTRTDDKAMRERLQAEIEAVEHEA